MEFIKSKSINFDAYAVILRRVTKSNASAYCPQLNLQINGITEEQVESEMHTAIYNHIEKISKEK
jgi:hypothetical protein